MNSRIWTVNLLCLGMLFALGWKLRRDWQQYSAKNGPQALEIHPLAGVAAPSPCPQLITRRSPGRILFIRKEMTSSLSQRKRKLPARRPSSTAQSSWGVFALRCWVRNSPRKRSEWPKAAHSQATVWPAYFPSRSCLIPAPVMKRSCSITPWNEYIGRPERPRRVPGRPHRLQQLLLATDKVHHRLWWSMPKQPTRLWYPQVPQRLHHLRPPEKSGGRHPLGGCYLINKSHDQTIPVESFIEPCRAIGVLQVSPSLVARLTHRGSRCTCAARRDRSG